MNKTDASLGEVSLTASLLRDVFDGHVADDSERECAIAEEILRVQYRSHGMGFLTRTLPKLGKALDRALAGHMFEMPSDTLLQKRAECVYPHFCGGLFNRVFHCDGRVRELPDINSISSLRQILYCWYKYELPYDGSTKQQVIDSFVRAEDELLRTDRDIDAVEAWMTRCPFDMPTLCLSKELSTLSVARRAKILLHRLFAGLDLQNIIPRHGPGSVSTKERLWEKYQWLNVSSRITEYYPFDEYFLPSLSAVCDMYPSFCKKLGSESFDAKVILVPKYSRGPRLISCEPVDNQWIQQGIRAVLYDRIENHVLTKHNVFFTNQRPNQAGALLGSSTGRFATLDLKEASDRVSLVLVRCLWPADVFERMACCRSLGTVLPDGSRLSLRKFAPMGSALCFPVMATTIWALLTAAAPDKETQEGILVYGDDIIVPTAYAETAINVLTAFGLKVNTDKSCTRGFFRESCGVDAYMGVDVTPVKLKTVWSQTPCPHAYPAWVEYANALWDKQYYRTYDYIVGKLRRLYWPVAHDEMDEPERYPIRLRIAPEQSKPIPVRTNKRLQRREYQTLQVKAVPVCHPTNGWDMLMRFFSEHAHTANPGDAGILADGIPRNVEPPSSVSEYTKRDTSVLVKCWR